jgi:ABC-2 type transport system permease protein/oleandomycin transport system permease protein
MTATTTISTAVPRVPQLSSRVGLVAGLRQTLTMAWRTVIRVRHNPQELADISFMPVMFTLLFTYVFGGAISGSRQSYLQFMIPGMLVMSMLFATLNVGQGINTDLNKGMFDRLRSLPIARWAPFAGRILGDQFKQAWSVALIIGVGMILGFRPESWSGVLGAAVLLLVFAAAFSWVSVLVGIVAKDAEKVQIFGFAVILPLNFISGVFAPTDTMPGWMDAFAQVNPVGILLIASRGLIDGEPDAAAVSWSLVWAAGIVVVFAALSVGALKRRG